MATKRKGWHRTEDRILYEPWTNDELATIVRLMCLMNTRWAREKLEPEAACTIRLTRTEIMLVTSRECHRRAFDLLRRAVGQITATMTEKRRTVTIYWPKWAEIQELRTLGSPTVTPRERPGIAPSAPAPAPAPGKEGNRKEGSSTPLSDSRPTAVGVHKVFEHWKLVTGRSRSVLDAKRKRVIERALKTWSVDELCDSISGYQASPHHQGQNDRGTKYNDIALYLRDATHIEAGLGFLHSPPATASEQKRDGYRQIHERVLARFTNGGPDERESRPAQVLSVPADSGAELYHMRPGDRIDEDTTAIYFEALAGASIERVEAAIYVELLSARQ